MRTIIFGLSLSISFLLNAQLPLGWEYAPTSSFHIIAIPLSTDPEINGVP
ncbi:MAG: hypothetical protein PHD61_11160 [Bacteroidales bacterium]|nr:hypothetical protein [Lentimicrobiaceae bacterium]MDD5695846.1 hypothetical protein [Bacteroidales bacterium]